MLWIHFVEKIQSSILIPELGHNSLRYLIVHMHALLNLALELALKVTLYTLDSCFLCHLQEYWMYFLLNLLCHYGILGAQCYQYLNICNLNICREGSYKESLYTLINLIFKSVETIYFITHG